MRKVAPGSIEPRFVEAAVGRRQKGRRVGIEGAGAGSEAAGEERVEGAEAGRRHRDLGQIDPVGVHVGPHRSPQQRLWRRDVGDPAEGAAYALSRQDPERIGNETGGDHGARGRRGREGTSRTTERTRSGECYPTAARAVKRRVFKSLWEPPVSEARAGRTPRRRRPRGRGGGPPRTQPRRALPPFPDD